VSFHDRLASIVRTSPWLMELLAVVAEDGPPGAWVAAGSVRDTVWDALGGRRRTGPHGDVDVVHFDPSANDDAAWDRRLRARLPGYELEVVNQAWVHEWHRAEGRDVPPAGSVAEALATWPETATAVAVRLGDEGIEVLAPLGLEDLFGRVARHNPAVASVAVFRRRVEAKRWRERWPGLEVVDGG
jgi:hypothetical protein